MLRCRITRDEDVYTHTRSIYLFYILYTYFIIFMKIFFFIFYILQYNIWDIPSQINQAETPTIFFFHSSMWMNYTNFQIF